jgi:DNA-binding CsgD family transcriptional regulator
MSDSLWPTGQATSIAARGETPAALGSSMWAEAEVVGLLDRQGCIRVVSRNEDEALIRHMVGLYGGDLLHPDSRAPFEAAFRAALDGKESHLLLAAIADDGKVLWGRTRIMPSPVAEAPVLFHARRLPKGWDRLSHRERDVVHALHETGMNPKRTARQLDMSVNTLNAHRRSICRKCRLGSVGEFWVFVERCR